MTLYSFSLWYYSKAPLAYSFKELRKMQRRVEIWILGTFYTSPTLGIKEIAGLILIYLDIQKLSTHN